MFAGDLIALLPRPKPFVLVVFLCLSRWALHSHIFVVTVCPCFMFMPPMLSIDFKFGMYKGGMHEQFVPSGYCEGNCRVVVVGWGWMWWWSCGALHPPRCHSLLACSHAESQESTSRSWQVFPPTASVPSWPSCSSLPMRMVHSACPRSWPQPPYKINHAVAVGSCQNRLGSQVV
jgi:hypothetical protein